MMEFAKAMRLDPLIRSCRSRTIETADGKYNAEPDASWQPVHRVLQKNTFPTVMVEIGRSQSCPSLLRVMRGWFEMSQGQVKIDILVDIRYRKSGRHEFIFEKWRCPDARPVLDTKVHVQLRKDFVSSDLPQANDFEVTTDPEPKPLPMVLEFELVCEQPPGPDQDDIHIPASTFAEIVSYTWVYML